MKKRSAFSEAKPRTAAGEARRRVEEVQDKLRALLDSEDEDSFRQGAAEFFELRPGEPHFEAALAAWREARRKL
jgi:hypothetical protein